MSKHLADQPRTRGMSRLAAFLQHERADGLHKAVRSLHARPQSRTEAGRKIAEYLRIARGRLG
ncbi:hypothetical protein [Paracoccus sp. (in: a-proteobacteria)]|uniref:hypothetical protein n=1 Tax=Paracoccus sp. TaxID=267 RepID=UPI00396CC22A